MVPIDAEVLPQVAGGHGEEHTADTVPADAVERKDANNSDVTG